MYNVPIMGLKYLTEFERNHEKDRTEFQDCKRAALYRLQDKEKNYPNSKTLSPSSTAHNQMIQPYGRMQSQLFFNASLSDNKPEIKTENNEDKREDTLQSRAKKHKTGSASVFS